MSIGILEQSTRIALATACTSPRITDCISAQMDGYMKGTTHDIEKYGS